MNSSRKRSFRYRSIAATPRTTAARSKSSFLVASYNAVNALHRIIVSSNLVFAFDFFVPPVADEFFVIIILFLLQRLLFAR